METKYYTPTIEEFHVGFESEYRDNPKKGIWKNVIADSNFIGIVESGFLEQDDFYIYEKRFRVKYLDREDIESLGWVFKKIIQKKYLTQIFDLEIFTLYLGFHDCRRSIIIEDNNNNIRMFFGWIKNKSELQRLMKQLGIIN